jgi:hypothetical protein
MRLDEDNVDEAKELEAEQRELKWLLCDIHGGIKSSIHVGLQECLSRLSEQDDGLKLVMSSNRSETLKGIVTRVGATVCECDIVVKLASANKGHPFHVKLKENETYPLLQVVDAVNFISEALQTTSRLTTDSPPENDVQTRIYLSETLGYVKSALAALREPKASSIYPHQVTDTSKFVDLPPGLVVDFYVSDSNVITELRTIEDIAGNHHTLDSFTSALSLKKKKQEKVVAYNGSSVVEHEHVKVESQDPCLISETAKLTAVESHLAAMVRKLQLCLGCVR